MGSIDSAIGCKSIIKTGKKLNTDLNILSEFSSWLVNQGNHYENALQCRKRLHKQRVTTWP